MNTKLSTISPRHTCKISQHQNAPIETEALRKAHQSHPSKAAERIFNTLPTLDDVLGPPEEVEIREMNIFSSSKKGEEIVDVVCHKIVVARSDVIKVDSDEEDNPPCVTRVQAMTLCKQLAGAVLEHGEVEDVFELSKQLCRYRAHLRDRNLTT
ncbi:hypothetical protein J3R83DRAFT_1827 [Lanmaoa asiatica]|nr:hypothetical protein J3R83DRAFT_1827 [Lanmaoa asiatica]